MDQEREDAKAVTKNAPRRLDPLLEWNLVGDERLQLRFPDGRDVTFEAGAAAIAQCLADLAAGVERRNEIADALIAFLQQRRGLTALADAGKDWAIDVYEYVLRQAGSRPGDTDRCVEMVREVPLAFCGEGWMHEQACAAAEALGMRRRIDIDDLGSGSLLLACADRYDPDLFLGANARALKAGAKVFFAHRQWGRIVLGPFVIPGQSACYACYLERRRANSRFKDEFAARIHAAATSRGMVPTPPSRIAAGLAQALLATHLLAAAAGAYELFEPGRIVAFDIVSLDKSYQSVLKLPRCPACSDAGKRPQRAIRAIV